VTVLLLVLDNPILHNRLIAEVQALAQQLPPTTDAVSVPPTLTATPVATPTEPATPTPSSSPTLVATATPTPPSPPALPPLTVPAGGQFYLLTPAVPEAVGWANSQSEQALQFGDYNLYAGHYQGESYISAVQFDLSAVPPGAPVVYADLTLVGLSAQYREGEGVWQMELLAPWIDERWSTLDYYWLAREESSNGAIGATVHSSELGPGIANHFVFPAELLPLVTARTYMGRLSVRLQGSESAESVLFAWDSGFGLRSNGQVPLLRLVTGPMPSTPIPSPTPYIQVITPESLVARARRLATATAEAAHFLALGTPLAALATPTPLPPYWVTPVVIVETPTPTPANEATAAALAAEATAQAFVYGTPTPYPLNVWTATPVVTIVALETPSSGSRTLCYRYGIECPDSTPVP
jgi:hypothetical protein